MAGKSRPARRQAQGCSRTRSVETYQGAGYDDAAAAVPRPAAAAELGEHLRPARRRPTSAQSLIVNLDGKLTYRQARSCACSSPFGQMYKPIGLLGRPGASTTPTTRVPTAHGDRASRTNRASTGSRSIATPSPSTARGSRTTRPASPRARTSSSSCATSSRCRCSRRRRCSRAALAFDADLTSYRAGGAIDGDVELSRRRCACCTAPRRSTSGSPTTHDVAPGRRHPVRLRRADDLTRLPILCPRIYDPTTMAIVPVAGLPADVRVPRRPHGARRVRRSAVAPEQEADLRRRRALQVAPAALGTLELRAQRHVRRHASCGTSSRTGT